MRDRVPVLDSRESSCPTEVVGVLVQPQEPSSLSVTETLFQKAHEDEDLEDQEDRTRAAQQLERAARRKFKQEQLKRLHRAQVSSGSRSNRAGLAQVSSHPMEWRLLIDRQEMH